MIVTASGVSELYSTDWDPSTIFNGELIMSFIIMGLLILLSIAISVVFRHADPTKPDHGFVMIIESAVEKLEAGVIDIMGPKYLHFTGYAMALSAYIFFGFFFGMIGFPSSVGSTTVTFSIGLITFVMFHAAAVRHNHWRYFHRFIEPFPIFLPVNLISMWSPLLSISLRLFGNALSGYIIMTMLYYYLGLASTAIFGHIMASGVASIWLAPLITPWLHMFFDLFIGIIQTMVFVVLTMVWIAQEDPDESAEEMSSLKQEAVAA